mmetsp:Transcript_32444/g.78781  ORF Transcript_32444/g.78781 Transcript_32444/m.78781 type:complete len:214 (+) Transcript_32444:250-891(+)
MARTVRTSSAARTTVSCALVTSLSTQIRWISCQSPAKPKKKPPSRSVGSMSLPVGFSSSYSLNPPAPGFSFAKPSPPIINSPLVPVTRKYGHMSWAMGAVESILQEYVAVRQPDLLGCASGLLLLPSSSSAAGWILKMACPKLSPSIPSSGARPYLVTATTSSMRPNISRNGRIQCKPPSMAIPPPARLMEPLQPRPPVESTLPLVILSLMLS